VESLLVSPAYLEFDGWLSSLLANLHRTSAFTIEVGDYISKLLIDAEKVYWGIGGSKPGVMTDQGKWAFAHRVYAEKFIREHGGTLSTFDEAMRAAYESMYAHTEMIRKGRKTGKGQGTGHQ
jgi:copper chaperone NosL